MPVKIDPDTGLPELPEPYVWWVGRVPAEPNSTLQVAIVRIYKISSENRADVYDPPPIHREPAVLVPGEPGLWPWSKAKIPSRWVQDYYFSEHVQYVAIHEKSNSLDNRIKNAAFRLIAQFNAERMNNEAATKLLGLYPPKSL